MLMAIILPVFFTFLIGFDVVAIIRRTGHLHFWYVFAAIASFIFGSVLAGIGAGMREKKGE